MTSIFERLMGEREFGRLHPCMRERFSVGLDSGVACVATGVMTRVWCRSAVFKPFLRVGASRHILFPETGREIPFTIENWPYLDRHGRETVTFTRTFEFPERRRRFDATMVYDPSARRLVDYLGTVQHLAVDLWIRADERGGVVITSSGQRWRNRRLDVPVPAALTGHAEVREWFDESQERFQIDVTVVNPIVGSLFGYRGTFRPRYLDLCTVPAPASAKPFREVAPL